MSASTTTLPQVSPTPSRWSEPSTYNGIAVALTAAATQTPAPYNLYVALVAAACGGVGMYLREAGNKPRAIAAIDAIESVVAQAKVADAMIGTKPSM
jgi:hypothetical protein